MVNSIIDNEINADDIINNDQNNEKKQTILTFLKSARI